MEKTNLTAAEMKEMCMALLAQWEEEDEFYEIGIRFEDKERQVGDVCEYSKHNTDREDEREFPEFGSEEYEDMYEFDGTSAWNLATYEDWADEGRHTSHHCYLIVGNRLTNRDMDLDDNEIVIEDAIVYAKIF